MDDPSGLVELADPVMYRQVEHTADLAIEISGFSLAALYRNAILAYFDLVAPLETIKPRRRWSVRLKANSAEDLLYQLLREVHYRHQAEGRLCRRARVLVKRGKPLSLRAELVGERFDPARHVMKDEIKAVTLHRLAVTRVRSKGKPSWKAFVVLDV